jgi:transcriptional regulator with XRE-family HTH domain
LLIDADYSLPLKFSQDESFSGDAWLLPQRGKRLPRMPKREPQVTPRFKKGPPRHFIRAWRKHRHLTQEQLASRVEMSTASISQLENGHQGYSQSTLEALAEALSCQPGDLLMRDPTVGEAAWSLLDSLKPETRRQALAMLRALKESDEAEKAA